MQDQERLRGGKERVIKCGFQDQVKVQVDGRVSAKHENSGVRLTKCGNSDFRHKQDP